MKLVSLTCAMLIGLVAWAAPPAAAKKKPVPARSATVRRAPVKTTGKSAAKPTGRRATASSRAVYSRSASSRRGGRTAQRTVKQPAHHWQTRPTTERYIEIQQALSDKGYYKGEVNGTWGTESVNALKDFQRSQNLDPDGKLGSLSLIALGMGPKRIVASNDPPPSPLPSPLPPAADTPRPQ